MSLSEAPTAVADGFSDAGTGGIVVPAIRDLLDYWMERRQGQLMPQRRSIDPVDVPWALSRVFVMDIDPPAGLFRYRLAGADVSAVFGRANLKDLTLEDILGPEKAAVVVERWRPLWERPAIVHMRGLIYLAAERGTLGERILLPLADESGSVAGILGYTHHDWETPTTGEALRMAEVNVMGLSPAP